MSKKLYIMDYSLNKVGEIEKRNDCFRQELNGKITEHQFLPRILDGIAPAPSQFPEINDVLDYYKMETFDLWTFFERSNGIKTSREHWFMKEPIGEVWLPLFIGDATYPSLNNRMKSNVECKVLMNGMLYTLRRPVNVLPKIVMNFVIQDGSTRFSTTHGIVYDLSPIANTRGLVGRLILNFPVKEN